LFASSQIGHRSSVRHCRKADLSDHLPVGLVKRAQYVSAATGSAAASRNALSNKEKRPGQQRSAATGAKRADIFTVSNYLIHFLPRTIPMRNLPHMFTFVQVDCGDPPERWFEQRQTSRSRSASSRHARILEIGSVGVRLA